MKPVEMWGRAEDGTTVRIVLEGVDGSPDASSDVVGGEWWPPMGLEKVDDPAEGGAPAHEVRVDVSQPDGWDRLESDLGLFTAERLHDVVAVHSAVLVRDGIMVLVPGESMTGKTTLCAAALEAGIEVWSDEYALVNRATGEVRGWPRRLRVRTQGGGANRVEIGAEGEHADAMVPTMVASVRFSGDHLMRGDALEVTPAAEGDVVFALLANTVCAQSAPERAFEAALAVASRARGVQGERGDAAEALEVLFDIASQKG